MAAADWIGLTGLAAVASFFYTVYSNRRERTARERGFAREQENRREEIALLRRQVEMAEQERADRGRASITAIRRQSGGAGSSDTYTFVLANSGQGNARKVRAGIVDRAGNILDQSVPLAAPVLRPGEDGEIRIHVRRWRSRSLMVRGFRCRGKTTTAGFSARTSSV